MLARVDPHSYADLAQGQISHLDLDLVVDFDARHLRGTACLTFAEPMAGPLDLDCCGLLIDAIVDDCGDAVPFVLDAPEPVLGQRLRIERRRPTAKLLVTYRTGPDASALMWLEPAQTSGGEHPFLISQCQAIHARSLVPLQDTPLARLPYRARLTIPEAMSAVMSAAPGDRSAGPETGTVTLCFSMPQPIPPYLLALAVGDLAYADLGPRTRVYAEPSVLDAAAWEFSDVEQMLQAAETLFGAYAWQRFDFIVLPPSFPLGGMENPRMTFLTPTLLAGDRSLVGVLAHELAHSWTGNLVTNANNEHFWLNEGWTVYAERRILEVLYGAEQAHQGAMLGRLVLDRVLEERCRAGQNTALWYSQAGLNPDEEFSVVPYEKGFLLITALERAVGRDRFDCFIHDYIEHFRFTSISTDQFAEFVSQRLGDAMGTVDLDRWIYEEGLPQDVPEFSSRRLDALTALARDWHEGARGEHCRTWTTNEKLYYMGALPDDLAPDDCRELGALLGPQRNAEVQSVWLSLSAKAGLAELEPELRDFLGRIGRTKLIRPVVAAMVESEQFRGLAVELVHDNLPRLHSWTRGVLTSLLREIPS